MRAVRKEGDKVAEIFYIIIKDTIEEKWFLISHKKDSDFITINEEGLNKVLNGEQPNEYKKPVGQFLFRF